MIICFTIDSFGDLLFQEKTMMRGEVNGAGEEKTTYIDATFDCSILKYKLMSQ